jgi:hypothetical protein
MLLMNGIYVISFKISSRIHLDGDEEEDEDEQKYYYVFYFKLRCNFKLSCHFYSQHNKI